MADGVRVTRYNAKDCSVMVDNTYITGLGETMINWEKSEPYSNASVGAQGDIVKSTVNNSLHTLTVTVQPTSPQLPFLMELKDRTDEFSVWVNNKSLGMKLGGTKANISEMPSIEQAAEASTIEISFIVYDGTTSFG